MRLRPDSVPAAVILTALVAFGPMSTDMYLPSLPMMTRDFGTDVGMVQLTLSVFLAGFAVSQLVYGPLSDRFGRRPMLLAGVGLYFLASAACILAPTVEALIGARFFQALGACAGPVLARAVVRDVHSRERAARVLAYMGTAMALAPLIAPSIGGYLAVAFGWPSVFVVLTAFGGLLWLAVALLLPETNRHLDAEAARPSRVARNYLGLLGSRDFVGHVLANACVYGGLFAFISGSSFVIIDFLGVPAQWFGACFAVAVAGYMAGTVTAARVTLRVGIERMVLIGATLALAAGGAGLALALGGVATLVAVLAPMFAFMVGVGLVMPNAMAGAIGPFPHMAGAASAMMGFLQMALAALVGFAVGQLDDGTQVPMTGAIAVMGLGAFLAVVVVLHRRDA